MVDLFERKDLTDYDKDIQKFINYFDVKGNELTLKGSSTLEHLNYRSDIDILVIVNNKITIHEQFNKLKKVLENIHTDDNIYFIELKLQTKDGDKIRFYHGESLSFTEFEKHYGKLDFWKIDVVVNVKNIFMEMSCVYSVLNKENLTRDEQLEDLNKDIEVYKAEGQYFKVLKRMFNVYNINFNTTGMEMLMRIFNSHLGKEYQTICILQAVELLHSNYKDDATTKKIEICLKLLNQSNNIKSIHRTITTMKSKLNKEAKKIYKGILTDARYD